MFANTSSEIQKICGQIDNISYRMIEAEGDYLAKLRRKLDKLERKLSKLDPNERDHGYQRSENC